ncbi:MAG TPA: Ni/Fe hydrogenase subunit alpha [Thermoplasmata archaeon]|nr:Ni/Fe hydrogenase subunit alpha [Thermoplasmata archaeon]
MTERTLAVDYLARVEGEGALTVRLVDGKVEDVALRIFEPPRFFEAFLVGRSYAEAPDITARICGICPVAYQMSACHALERALGIRVDPALRALRRLLYCGEWIESHALHLYLLHAPDFLHVPDAIALAKQHPGVVERGLALKRAGNTILEVLGGREVHPINVRVGGFYRCPTVEEMAGLRRVLEAARSDAAATIAFAAGLPYPDYEAEYEFVALSHPTEYPMNDGDLVSNRGLRISADRFDSEFTEVQVPYSHALQCVRRDGGSYLVGPLARYALNSSRLDARTSSLAREAGLGPVERNPFRSLLVRAVEIHYAVEEAIRLVDAYAPPARPYVPPEPGAGTGEGAWTTEAPRGILFHRYRLDADGRILEARIVPPTSQNQRRIEEDLRGVVTRSIDRPDAELTDLCERTIRNYDPCISCATHFLKLSIERG